MAYKGLRNICNNLTRKTKDAYHKNIKENRLNPRNFWNSIKEIFPTKSGTKNSNSKTPQTNKRLADSFGNYFSIISAVRKLKTQALILKEFVWKSPRISVLRTNKTFRFDYVSKVFISSFLKKMKRNKSTGLDELPPGMLKDCREYIVTPSITSSTFHSSRRLSHQLGSRQNWCLSLNLEIRENLKTTDPFLCCQFFQSC